MATGISSARLAELEEIVGLIKNPVNMVSVLNFRHRTGKSQKLTSQEKMFVRDKLRQKFPFLCEDCEDGVISSID